MKQVGSIFASIWILAICSSSLAAGNVGLRTYLSSLPRVVSLSQIDLDAYVFSYKQQTSYPLILGLKASSYQNEHSINEFLLYIPREELTRTEIDLLNEVALSLVLKCFNIRPDRKPAIADFMATQAVYGWRTRAADFGPLEVQYEHQLISDHTATVVWLRRSGTPGQSPWINYCTF
ncbi:hypothetical protein [Deinococcus sp.]|uniref:hypothetical protein n=1 Tax=Deinococcus sp. TaxID=47478 RepID=UPI003C7B8657